MKNWASRIAGLALALGGLLLAGCEWPPQESSQNGYRGTGMLQVRSPERIAAEADLHGVPEPIPPAASGGPRAGDVYENVQVLGDLSVGEFTRLMLAITEWVSPEQGCNYCHVGENFAGDMLYTKVVSRRMIQMTQHVNGEWQDHVANTGVTCYTCHRGQNVPGEIWFNMPPRRQAGGFADRSGTQNMAGMEAVAYSTLPGDPFTTFLEDRDGPDGIRVIGASALPMGGGASTKDAEHTYGLMMHMSDGLGVNCTYCHNSRAFAQWDESTPQRVTSWYGIRMVADLNADYLNPLQPVYPDNRLGPTGDAPKTNCATCHRGVAKPLNGVSMLADYPNLAGD